MHILNPIIYIWELVRNYDSRDSLVVQLVVQLPLQGARVPSLVTEPGFHKPHSATKKKKKKKEMMILPHQPRPTETSVWRWGASSVFWQALQVPHWHNKV